MPLAVAMNKKNSRLVLFILIAFFVISSAFVLSFPYPIGEQRHPPDFPKDWTGDSSSDGSIGGEKQPPTSSEIWAGGTIPDEGGYFGWAQIYYETGKIYIPLEEIGTNKIQHIDFFIGDSPENCIFAKVDVSRDNHDKSGLKIKSRNITVTAYDGENNGIKGAYVEIAEIKKKIYWNGFSNEDGKFTVENVPPGTYVVNLKVGNATLKNYFATDYFNLNYPIVINAYLENWSPSGTKVNIHVDHYINPNLKDVDIYLGFNWEQKNPIGHTDEQGNYSLQIPIESKMYHVVAVKETNNISTPVASGIVEVDGDYAIANHWPPGYCYIIIPFWTSGLINFINIFICAIACLSTYFLAKRLYDQKIAVIASTLIIASGIAMVMIYSRGMADYAAMAFGTAGIALVVESIQDTLKKNRMFLPLVLGLMGGLSFAFAVTMRYSVVVILIGPLVYVFINLIKKSYLTNCIISTNPKVKKYNKKKFCLSMFANFSSLVKKSLPFILGLIIIGCLLASYNTTLFGSPLNSGYQMDTMVEIDESGNSTIETPDETMFEQYFNPSVESIQNIINRILPQLFLLLPTLFIFPLGLLLDFRRNRAWLLAFWIIPTLFIYMQLTWVGQVPVEDMRYFLPVLPPAAILSAYTISKTAEGRENRKNMFFILLSLTLLIITGFLIAHYGINWQIHRRELGRIFNPPLIALVIVSIVYLLIYSETLSKIFTRRKSIR
jgi:hypothetical protein